MPCIYMKMGGMSRYRPRLSGVVQHNNTNNTLMTGQTSKCGTGQPVRGRVMWRRIRGVQVPRRQYALYSCNQGGHSQARQLGTASKYVQLRLDSFKVGIGTIQTELVSRLPCTLINSSSSPLDMVLFLGHTASIENSGMSTPQPRIFPRNRSNWRHAKRSG